MKRNLEEKLKLFSFRKDKISLQRMSISKRCFEFADYEVCVCRLIVPTGGGKTLSSFRFAIEYCIKYDKKRIFYIAPFMSILEQNSDELRSLTGDEYLLEHHSDMLGYIENEKEFSDYELKTDKWDMPVIATTLVQFLNTLFSGKMSSVRRMHQLCNSVIIIDEVQSVPLKCVNLFNLAVNFLSRACGCTMVLCSATQPAFDATSYPVIYDDRKDMIEDYQSDFEVFRRTELIPEIIPGGYSFESAAEYCFDKFLEFGSTLVVVNTKKAALEIFKNIKEKIQDDTDLFHLSTNMCPKHRKDVLKKMKKLLMENKKIICVTTQLIEAGVDISFECVVRSAAGMDNVAQAAGRCNRHGEKNRICPVFVININENLTHLKEIDTARNIAFQFFDNDNFEDYLSPDIMEQYFKKLYESEKDKLSYNISDNQTTLIDLLSKDSKRWSINQYKDLILSSQAFKTAGEKFEVIGSNTVAIVVPYDSEAENLILDMNSECDSDKYIALSRKAQKYSVSVYSTAGLIYKLLEQKAIERLSSGTLALKKEFYDKETGIGSDGQIPELLLF